MVKVVEIDESELVRLNGLNNFAHKMLSHPEAGKLLEQAAKIVDPNTKTPRLDAAAHQIAPVKAVEDELAKLKKQIEDRDAEAARNQTLNALRTQRDSGISSLRSQGWTDEGIKGVEKIMEEKGILDPLDAAAIFEKHHPPQNVAMPGSTGGWNFMDGMNADDSDADLKKLIETKGEVDSVADHIARKALHDVRQQTPARR